MASAKRLSLTMQTPEDVVLRLTTREAEVLRTIIELIKGETSGPCDAIHRIARVLDEIGITPDTRTA